MGKIIGMGVVIVVCIALADAWANAGGVSTALNGVRGVETPVINGMLGQAS